MNSPKGSFRDSQSNRLTDKATYRGSKPQLNNVVIVIPSKTPTDLRYQVWLGSDPNKTRYWLQNFFSTDQPTIQPTNGQSDL